MNLLSLSSTIAITTISITPSIYPSWHVDALDNNLFRQDSISTMSNKLFEEKVYFYIIDSGVNKIPQLAGFNISHVDFTADAGTALESIDCQNHGTKIATSIIGQQGFFRTPNQNINIISLKVLPCSNRVEDGSPYSKALKWIWLNHNKEYNGVVNLSLSGLSDGEHQIKQDTMIIESLNEKNLLVVASAGNYSKNACDYSPANIEPVITVGAIQSNYTYNSKGKLKYNKLSAARFSNHGKCIDYWSFGERVLGYDKDGHLKSLSGTSLSAPLVSGILLTYLAYNSNATIHDAQASLNKNSRNINLGKKYGWVKVPYIGSFFKNISEVKIKPLTLKLCQFSMSELCFTANKFLDHKEIIVELYENGVLTNSIESLSYAEGYGYDIIKINLNQNWNNPTIKVYSVINKARILIGTLTF